MKAILLISYGSPESRADVGPFLQNLFNNKPVSDETVSKIAQQYDEIAISTGRFSPLNEECRNLISGVLRRLNEQADKLPVYWGNLYWYPLLDDTVSEMKDDGIENVTAFITSPFDSDFSRKRYINAVEKAISIAGNNAPKIELSESFGNVPLYIKAVVDRVLQAAAYLFLEHDNSISQGGVKILFTAHSLPLSDAGSDVYVSQIKSACEQVAKLLHGNTPPWNDAPPSWELVFQSRSGRPADPWLEPDICVRIRELAEERAKSEKGVSLIIVPIGFLLENKETAYDLDMITMDLCGELEIPAVRAATVGPSPEIIELICRNEN